MFSYFYEIHPVAHDKSILDMYVFEDKKFIKYNNNIFFGLLDQWYSTWGTRTPGVNKDMLIN